VSPDTTTLWTAGVRQYRSFVDGSANGSIRPITDLPLSLGAIDANGVETHAEESTRLIEFWGAGRQRDSLGDALAAGWRVHARCLGGFVGNIRSTAKCHYQAELNLETLVWTRGRNMPLAGLRERMMCPRCGNRRVNLIFDPPAVAMRAPAS
jgi:hypothetical protein